MASSIKHFFTDTQQKQIVEAIRAAELNSSGEIRVHLEARTKLDPVTRAREVFSKLKMHKTKARNGVLFYLAIDDHKFAVIGDSGIDTVVHDGFWEKIKDTTIEKFKKGEFTEGLIQGILEIGNSLKEYFPYHRDDENEQEDEISFG